MADHLPRVCKSGASSATAIGARPVPPLVEVTALSYSLGNEVPVRKAAIGLSGIHDKCRFGAVGVGDGVAHSGKIPNGKEISQFPMYS